MNISRKQPIDSTNLAPSSNQTVEVSSVWRGKTVSLSTSQKSRGVKRPLPTTIHQTEPKRKKARTELQVQFLQGSSAHEKTYAQCIDRAESQIIIASWNVNFIPKNIFSSLMRAKKRGVYITFIVQSVKREETLDYFYDDGIYSEDSCEETFQLVKTKSHAKFLFVDSKTLILGSYNALGDSYEETLDASFLLSGSYNQMWPFYMSMYESYVELGENLSGIFGGIASCSRYSNPGPRQLLRRFFDDESQMFLLRNVQEHEDFLKQATPHNGDVTIYSPFSTRDNTRKRLQTLANILPATANVHLKVLPRFKKGLARLLKEFPSLQNRSKIEEASSHQKVMILGLKTICVGSLNWLSAAQNAKASYGNIEFSIVLQGPKAEAIIKKYYKISNYSD